MKFIKKLFNRTGRAIKGTEESLEEKIRACEKAYGVKLSFKTEEELFLWLSARDPYMVELLCEA